MKKKNFATTLCRSGVRGGAGRCSPGASSTQMQIVPFSSSLYPVFHSVIYNSVPEPIFSTLLGVVETII